MNLNIYEKSAIILTGILFASAIAYNVCKPKNTFPFNNANINLSVIDEYKMPEHMREISQALNSFKDLYDTDEIIFTYGYTPLAIEKDKSEKFHNKLTQALEEAHLNNYKVVPYKNYEQALLQAQEANGKDVEACSRFNPGEEDLETIIKVTEDCLRATCVIDMKNNKYYTISRDIPFIIEKLEELNPPQKI